VRRSQLFFVDWDRDRFLGWADKIGPQRLEGACGIMVLRRSSPSYQQLKSILEKNMDIPRAPEETVGKTSRRGFQRGAEYFGGGDHA
jgi:hypothetical protein